MSKFRYLILQAIGVYVYGAVRLKAIVVLWEWRRRRKVSHVQARSAAARTCFKPNPILGSV